ncbi:hypothetical protein SPRG_05458 [Saprolegnia parasitica CBS 223.65]|uniref:Uncharacterized protein n=1 Tax=Saprolegnia parasitica (strain CBS 223.65) TaxID=695850 RepID=A0A067CFM2_SAPPC|nr:hypothetical protein SPRG_05458 [Saprolegnia parasitica CBS 223.65]KDO29278.1 hypothetical protein SPRG_05458 [Saprolegnia parasitica CBS 223.65]|eukprot:XP_012200092.1 hypothetical protein SPRG_05458 [Saprolegnia parasitica CBS 223.65]
MPASDDRRAFLAAAKAGDVCAIAACLADRSCNPNAHVGNGWTALHFAVYHGNMDVVRLLVASPRVDVNALTICGTSPIALALQRQGSRMLEILLVHGCRRTTIPPAMHRAVSSLSEDVQHKLSPAWSVVWTPLLHPRFPQLQRDVCFVLLCANAGRHRRGFFSALWPRAARKTQWVYLPPPLLDRILEYYFWLD